MPFQAPHKNLWEIIVMNCTWKFIQHLNFDVKSNNSEIPLKKTLSKIWKENFKTFFAVKNHYFIFIFNEKFSTFFYFSVCCLG